MAASYEELAFLNALLINKDTSIFRKHNITEDHFIAYHDVLSYIVDYQHQYKDLPPMDQVLSKFEDFDKVEIGNLEYVSAQLRRERLMRQIKPYFEKGAHMFNEGNYEDTLNYLLSEGKILKQNYTSGTSYHDWAANADARYNKFEEMVNTPQDQKGISTGFPALDDVFNGGLKGGDLAVVFARLKNGKSWIGERMILEAYLRGYNPGLWSLEMDEYSSGYRLDTMYQHYSNKGLLYGDINKVSLEGYKAYSDMLKSSGKHLWILTNEQNGKRKWSIRDIEATAEELNMGLICIDQLSLLAWGRKFYNKTAAYEYMVDEAKTMAQKLNVPVVLLAQAGRQVMAKIKEDKNAMPDNEDAQHSDAILQYADKGISIRKCDDIVRMKVTANRGGEEGALLNFRWNFDSGIIEDFDPNTANM